MKNILLNYLYLYVSNGSVIVSLEFPGILQDGNYYWYVGAELNGGEMKEFQWPQIYRINITFHEEVKDLDDGVL